MSPRLTKDTTFPYKFGLHIPLDHHYYNGTTI